MQPYFRKHQTLDISKKAPKDPKFMPDAAREKYHGTDGPIHTSFNDTYCPIEVSTVHALSLLALLLSPHRSISRLFINMN